MWRCGSWEDVGWGAWKDDRTDEHTDKAPTSLDRSSILMGGSSAPVPSLAMVLVDGVCVCLLLLQARRRRDDDDE